MITVHFETKEQEEISYNKQSVQALLAELHINPETVLVVRNDEVLTNDILLQDGDNIQLLSVISGG